MSNRSVRPGTTANTIGDAAGGFSTEVDVLQGRVHVAAWGFWSVDVATSFAPTLVAICEQNPEAKHVLIDVRELKPMREEGQDGFGMFVSALDKLGVQRVTIVAAGPLTKLQLLRIARERAAKDSVDFVER